jgi:hypothetical protein
MTLATPTLAPTMNTTTGGGEYSPPSNQSIEDLEQITKFGKLVADALYGGVIVLDDKRFQNFILSLKKKFGMTFLDKVLEFANANLKGVLTFTDAHSPDQWPVLTLEIEGICFDCSVKFG